MLDLATALIARRGPRLIQIHRYLFLLPLLTHVHLHGIVTPGTLLARTVLTATFLVSSRLVSDRYIGICYLAARVRPEVRLLVPYPPVGILVAHCRLYVDVSCRCDSSTVCDNELALPMMLERPYTIPMVRRMSMNGSGWTG